MKRTIGADFQFEVPEDWNEFRDGARHVWQGPGPPLQELIIQGTLLEGEGSERERELALDALIESALAGLRAVLYDDTLAVERRLGPDASLPQQAAWTATARVPGDQTLFCAGVFRGSRGVLLVTYEARPEAPGDAAVFEAVVRSVRRAGEPHS